MTQVVSNAHRVEIVTSSLPSWVPSPGQFANVSTNTMSSVDPCPGGGCVYSDVSGQEAMFIAWGGGTYCPNYGAYGGIAVHSGGHAAYGGNEVYVYDIANRVWVRCGSPSPYTETSANSNGEYPDGKPFPPHTYNSLAYLSPANGGGTSGSLLRFGFPGGGYTQWAHRMDLATGVWSRWCNLSSGIGGQTYSAVAYDSTRNRYWVCSSGNSYFTGFGYVSAAGVATALPNQGDNTDTGAVLGFCPQHDMLVHFAFISTVLRVTGRLCTATAPTGFATLNVTGSGPSDCHNGLEWSTILNCFVSYPANGSTTVYKLTPPATNPLTNAWVWTSESLTGASGAVPSVATGTFNGHWSRFREVPALKSFIFVDGRTKPAQLWRLAGMT